MKFTVVLDPATEGGYSVLCPALPGCVSEGDDYDESLANIREAILLWSEVWLETHAELPKETPGVVAEAVAACIRERADEGLPLTIETREVEVDTRARV
jgi:predicted RNase H-like HicB family nuclease